MLFFISNDVFVYREKGEWKGLYKVIIVINKNVIIVFNVLNGMLIFKSTYIKLYI